MPDACSGSSVSPSGSIDNSVPLLSSLNSGNVSEDVPVKYSDKTMRKMEAFLHKNVLVDVTLIAEDKRIPAHRLVLSAASDYFAVMFTSDVREATQSEIVLQAVDADALSACVQYCYTGHVSLREDTVEMILSTACLLQLAEVVEQCSAFMIKQLDPSNCLGMSLFADSQGCLELYEVSQKYITKYFLDVVHNQEFLLLPLNEVKSLLNRDDLNVLSEEAIFHTILKWLEHNPEDRKSYAAELLGLVHLPLLPPQFIPDHIENNAFFKNDKPCQELIMEAMRYHLLPERRSSLQSHRTNPRKSTVGLMYAVGGMDSIKGPSTIEVYDYRTNTWSKEAHMTGRRLQFGVAVMKNKLYVVGGRDGLKTLSTVECYDRKTKQWSTVSSMTTHRHGLSVAVLEGVMYAVGGHDGWSYLSSVERWDPLAKQWSYIASMSTQRSTAGVTVLNNRLYAVGGRDGTTCLRSVEWFDPHTNRWTLCAPMSQRRGWVGVGVLNDYLYAVGGHDAPQTSHSNPCASRYGSVERYDPKTDSWTVIASLSVGRDAVAVCVLGNKLFAVGGYDGTSCRDLTEAYNEQNNEWTQVAKLNIARAGACVVVIKNDGEQFVP